MIRVTAGLSTLALLGACAIPPQGVTQTDLQFFDEAVASIGCSLETEADYLPVELQTGLTRETVQKIAAFKVAADQAETLPSGGIKLTTGACA